MANPGVGNKFVSVNLNKSYGQRPTSLGNVGASRVRSTGGGHGVGGGGGGGGGMVVLSRSRSSIVGAQKGGPKLSVPPPLNLPSLRKEHERFDSSASGGGAAGAGSAGAGARPASSGIGWTKPSPPLLNEKEGGNDHSLFDRPGVESHRVDGSDPSLISANVGLKNSVYMPPSARSGTVASSGPSVNSIPHEFVPVEKAVVLRGEDFPSLHATLPTQSGGALQKQKGNSDQKQSKKGIEEASDEQMGNSYLRPPLVMQPQNQSSRLSRVVDDKHGGNQELGGFRRTEKPSKQDDIFPSPLPLLRLNHTSDWADDERDTKHGLPDRDRDHGYLRNESFRDRDNDLPRGSVIIPRGSVLPKSDAWVMRDDDFGRPSSREALRANSYGREMRIPSREGRDGSPWRASPVKKDGFSTHDIGFDRNSGVAWPLGPSREMNKESKYGQLSFGYGARDGYNSGNVSTSESRFGRRGAGYGQGTRQNGNLSTESYGARGTDKSKMDQYGGDMSNHYRSDGYQNNFIPKTSGKVLSVNDSILNVGREKRLSSKKQYIEDPFLKELNSDTGFDGRDPLTGSLVGVLRRKKDVIKQADFHDPVRESFEAELERVQQMQEQERQRVIEEQARALELARKEEEEKERIAREAEARRRRIEEEAREAAWRAEQEVLEAVRRAEELKVAREEEKQRAQLEEERRKEAARQKLLELEARIARRQAEGSKDNEFPDAVRDERMPGVAKGKDVYSRAVDVVDWEDGERMVERITSSASSDSSSLNRSFEVGSRPQLYRDGDPAILDRGKPVNSWRRDATFDNGNNSYIWQDQDNGYRSPQRDAFSAGRAVARKDFHGGPGSMPARISTRGGFPDPHSIDDFSQPRGNRWNLTGEGNHYNLDPEFHDNFPDKFYDMGWGQGRSRGSPHAPYPERLYQNSESDGLSSFGRSRYSVKQPRVLPPPSLTSAHKSTFRTQIERPGSSASLDGEITYHNAPRQSDPIRQVGYSNGFQDVLEQPSMVDAQEDNTISLDKRGDKTTSRCDSQSSLSVSSPPDSPTHLSHDDLEDSGNSPLPTAREGEEIPFSENDNVLPVVEVGHTSKITASGSVSSVEDEEWAIDNHQELSEQEEYDEDETGYREEDEVHGEDSQNVDLSQELKNMHFEEEEGMSRKMSQVVLGFNEGVEVGIPSGDEYDRATGTQKVSADISEEHGSSDRVVDIGKTFQSGNSSADGSTDSSKLTHEADKAPLDLSLQPVNVTYSSTASSEHMTDNVETSSTSQQPLATSANEGLPSSTVQPTTLPVSAGPGQPEVPVKLQFGLFSGPSLIPSPVPAIQIGSIQMPLHYPQVGPSLTQLHPSQPPFFQFGQLRYASPISQGLLPLGPQSMSFVQPSIPAHYSLNPNQEGILKNQAGQETGIMNHSVKDQVPSVTLDDHPGLSKLLDQSQVDLSKKVNVLPVSEDEPKARPRSVSHMNDQGHHSLNGRKNYSSIVSNKESEHQMQMEPTTSQYISKAPGPMSSNKGKRYVYTVRNSGSRVSHPVSESPHTDVGGFRRRGRQKIQRTEFRVRENVDKRQREGLVSPNYAGAGEKSHVNGAVSGYVQSSGQKDVKPSKMVESESLNLHVFNSGSKMDRRVGKEVHVKKPIHLNVTTSGEANFKRNNSTEEDVDAPLQSGIVRVFKQPGIEAPSDEDDFIEVRSKRQMLNDRREQREKEIKAKSRAVKASRKRRSISQNNVVQTNLNKVSTSFGGEAASTVHSKPVVTDGQGMMKVEGSTGFINNIVSPPLAPIGTPAGTSDIMADSRSRGIKSPQTASTPIINVGTKLVAGLTYDNKNALLDKVPTSLGPWGTARVNQQVMALTQTQLDEAMKSMRIDTHMATVGDHTTNKLSSSIMTHDKSFSSAASPLNSLLAGEKIQFGAVTSPTILPATSLSVSSGIGQAMDHKVHNLSAVENDCTLFFKKDKQHEESCVGLEDPEAEAEAAASAVAVAAISSDEIVGNGCSVPVSDAKSFVGGENESLTSEGGASNQQTVCQSRGEESLSVALPADLSVETPSLSLWPSLPSPQNSSGQMLSHFSGGPPSHFPCYEMNPMLGGHIFAFGPHDESAGTHPQSQKSNASGPGSLAAWQQCHSGVDSFYGPPTGFTGPFISPSGGIPGVQGPPHMVVYNHFAPVGQFGQVGLSFMGTTYIPSGKQPDWKHNPASSAMGVSEGDMSNLNISSAQRNAPNMPAPVQHLAPGSPLMPMASPLAMFDMSPFSSSTEVPAQTRWSHVPASALHSPPVSMPMQQQSESGLPSQFSLGGSMDQSSGNRFHVPSSSATEGGRNYPVAANTTVGQLPDEFGLADPSSTSSNRVSASRPTSYSSTVVNGKSQNVVPKSLSRSNAADGTVHSNNSNSSSSSSQSMNLASKSHATQQQTSSQQYLHTSGSTDQRGGGVPQRSGSGGEWSHRRTAFQGRNQSSGTEKKINSSKVKQIYVAKPTSRTSTSM